MDNDARRKWFVWGMLLAWTPSVPLIFGVLDSLRRGSEQKAVGISAVAGGLAEVYLTSGLILTFIFLVGAIVLLGRSFCRGHRMRTILSVLSMGWSALILFILGLLVWMLLTQLPHRTGGPR
jgi:hypothetical protein